MGLPGDKTRMPHAHHRCETPGHEMIPATWRIQGETDSFGAEYGYFCDECIKNQPTYWFIGTCPRCGAEEVELYGYRDPDEGSSGPVYHACSTCRRDILASFIVEEEKDEW